MTNHFEGGNYSLDIADGVAVLRVWKRPDLSVEAGALLAVEVAAHLTRITEGYHPGVTGIVLDLRVAPELVGTRTRAVIGKVVAKCEDRGMRFALVTGSASQEVIVEHVMKQDPKHVRLIQDIAEARTWAAKRSSISDAEE